MNKALLPHPRVLLVDDNSHGNVARRVVLESHGFQVETALSGEEALEVFLANPFDLLVTDFKMGRMDGIALIARVRATGHPVLTILLSGFADGMGLTEESTGADAVLNKSSMEGEQLPRTIARLLARRKRKPAASENRPAKKMKTNVARSG